MGLKFGASYGPAPLESISIFFFPKQQERRWGRRCHASKTTSGFREGQNLNGIDSLGTVMSGILVQGPKAILANSSGIKSGLIPTINEMPHNNF